MIRKMQVVQARRVNAQNHRPSKIHVQSTIPNELLFIQPKNTLYPKNALVISLPQSTYRLQRFQQFNVFNGVTEVIEAVDGSKLPKVPEGVPLRQGSLGCLLSHKKALEYARDKNFPCVLIFEDDAEMIPTFSQDLKVAMSELPENWDMLWLAGMDAAGSPSYQYSDHLKRVNGSWGTYAYVINSTVYDYFIDLFAQEQRSSDDYYRMNHARFASFRTNKFYVAHFGAASVRIEIDRKGV